MVGLFGGFAYLAYTKKQFFVMYGLGLIGLGFMFQGFAELAPDKATEIGYVTFLRNLRNVAFGAGAAFLGYVAATEGFRYYERWRAKRRVEAEQFQLSLKAHKDAEPTRPVPSR
ncbi:MAG: hypothetical protein HYT80_06315 [Euryarchaeota archaeon]|nr:hypothetical protein [Euryarchaeota archaeon]